MRTPRAMKAPQHRSVSDGSWSQFDARGIDFLPAMPKGDSKQSTFQAARKHPACEELERSVCEFPSLTESRTAAEVFSGPEVLRRRRAIGDDGTRSCASTNCLERSWTQRRAPAALGIAQPDVSDLMRGKLARFSQERLERFLIALDMDVHIKVAQRKPTVKRGRLSVELVATL